MTSNRRKFTVEYKVHLLQEAEEQGVTQTLRKGNLSNSVLSRWCSRPAAALSQSGWGRKEPGGGECKLEENHCEPSLGKGNTPTFYVLYDSFLIID